MATATLAAVSRRAFTCWRSGTLSRLEKTAIREIRGATCLNSSRRFAASSTFMLMIPVILPPGSRKDVTSPASIGSAETANTIGMVLVTLRAARAAGVTGAKITSGFAATICVRRLRVARSDRWRTGGRRRRSALRHNPALASSRRTRHSLPLPLSPPQGRQRARAVEPAAPPRRAARRSELRQRRGRIGGALLDHLIGAEQQRRRDRQAERLRRLHVDDEFEPRGLNSS